MPEHIRIAIIEGNPEVAQLYRSYFTSRGYDVQTTQYVEGVSPDTAVVIGEPDEISATLFVDVFRQHYPNIPLIVASKRPDLLSGTRNIPLSWAITKPFLMQELEELVEVASAGEEWEGEMDPEVQFH